MEFLKRFSSFLMPLGLVAGGVVFLVISMIVAGSTQARMEESISAARKIKSLQKDSVSAEQWKIEARYMERLSEDADAIKRAAAATSQRELLSYRLFPEPRYQSQQIFEDFGKKYRQGVEDFVRQMGGGAPPSDDSSSGLPGAFDAGGSPERFMMGPMGPRPRTGSSTTSRAGADREIWDKTCEARARSIRVYADPYSFAGYLFWDGYSYAGAETASKDCWLWQLAYWIQTDIAEATDTMNAGARSVLDAPVKRLVGISFEQPKIEQPTAGRSSSIEGPPQYVDLPDSGLVESLTAHCCDDDVDVVHFTFKVMVDSSNVLSFIEELCRGREHKFYGWDGQEAEQEFTHNQITVLDYDMQPADRNGDRELGYRYGKSSVTELNLVCEYIFVRSGYDAVKPEIVKEELGQGQQEAPAGGRRGSQPRVPAGGRGRTLPGRGGPPLPGRPGPVDANEF